MNAQEGVPEHITDTSLVTFSLFCTSASSTKLKAKAVACNVCLGIVLLLLLYSLSSEGTVTELQVEIKN